MPRPLSDVSKSGDEIKQSAFIVKFVALYGPPAVGKMTVAKEISRLTGVKLLHNHLTWNAVPAVFEGRSEPFIRALPEMRRVMFREAARADIDLLFTYVFSLSRKEMSESYFDSVEQNGGVVCLVHLYASSEVLEERVVGKSRAEVGKMNTVEALRDYLEKVTDTGHPIPGRQSLELDTGVLSPEAAANAVIAHYGLSKVDRLYKS